MFFGRLGAAARRLRLRRGWSVTQVAVKAGVSKRAIEYFEGGETVPTYPVLRDVLRVYGVRVSLRLTPAKRAGGAYQDADVAQQGG